MGRPLTTMAVLAAVVLHGGCATDESRGREGASPETVRRAIRPDHFPAGRPYSFGMRVGDTVYLSGQLGRNLETGTQPDGVAEQTRQAMENIGAVLAADGLGHEHLVKCHVYLASMDDYAGMNQMYGSFFTGRYPARTTVEIAGMPSGAAVQIACVAYADVSGISVVRPPEGALPGALGPYSPAVWAGDTLYLSGMGGQNPADGRVDDRVPAQVTQTLANIQTTLTSAGLGPEHVVSTHVYLTTPDAGEGFAEAFAAPFPAGTAPQPNLVFLPRLPGGIKAELTFVAARRTDNRVYAHAVSEPGSDVDAQARAVFERLRAAVEEGGLVWGDVALVQVYLADLADMQAVNAVFREWFPDQPPARSVVQTRLPGESRVQIGLVAAR